MFLLILYPSRGDSRVESPKSSVYLVRPPVSCHLSERVTLETLISLGAHPEWGSVYTTQYFLVILKFPLLTSPPPRSTSPCE